LIHDANPTLVQAKFLATMDSPGLLRDAAVVMQGGRIVAVDSATSLRREHPHAQVIDLAHSILLPGLVNAHVHLELSNCECGPAPGGTFGDWIMGVRARMKIDPENQVASIESAVQNGIDQCLKFGVTCVGDITNFIEISRGVLRTSPLRAVSYGEALGLAKLRPRFVSSLARALEPGGASERLQIGLSPHAPYTVDLAGYRECVELARQGEGPLATHLAENPEERELLTDHSGMFREVWEKLGLWDSDVVTYRGSPIEFADAVGLLSYPKSLLAHVNYCDDAEMAMLAEGNASVVYCPRTHAYFGHPPHRWREMLTRGINVAVGTDSCASSPDLNLVDDLRLLRNIAPEIDATVLWEMATTRAASAIGMHESTATLSPGKSADMIAFDVSSDQPLEELLRENVLPTSIWTCGHLVS
jgi:aminodeoxyfutalosine deaminase